MSDGFTGPALWVAYGSPNAVTGRKRHKPIANDSLSEDEMLKFWTSVFTLVAGVATASICLRTIRAAKCVFAQAMTLSGSANVKSLVWVYAFSPSHRRLDFRKLPHRAGQ